VYYIVFDGETSIGMHCSRVNEILEFGEFWNSAGENRRKN